MTTLKLRHSRSELNQFSPNAVRQPIAVAKDPEAAPSDPTTPTAESAKAPRAASPNQSADSPERRCLAETVRSPTFPALATGQPESANRPQAPPAHPSNTVKSARPAHSYPDSSMRSQTN